MAGVKLERGTGRIGAGTKVHSATRITDSPNGRDRVSTIADCNAARQHVVRDFQPGTGRKITCLSCK